MGEYADMAIEQAMNMDDYYLDRMFDRWDEDAEDSDYFSGPRSRKDRRRKRVPKCQFCGAYPLRIEEFDEGHWHLAEFDSNNILTRHVCKMRGFGRSTR